jgi:hypothetical protein
MASNRGHELLEPLALEVEISTHFDFENQHASFPESKGVSDVPFVEQVQHVCRFAV